LSGAERLYFTPDVASAISFTFNDACDLVAVSNSDLAYVTTTAELTEVFLFPPGTAGFTALVCSVADDALDCAIGVRNFAVCPAEGAPLFFEDGATPGCSPITLNLIYES